MNIGGIISNFAANINSIAASFMINAAFFSQGVGKGSSRCGQGKLKVWAGEAQGVGGGGTPTLQNKWETT